jgi:hypothetical protein
MVKICSNSYPVLNETQYSQYFEKYPFKLSSFQKYAIEAIVEGHHSLSCVPTGSGKTMPAIFAIDFFTSKKKKVIYTSPIKALSNQKYYEFTHKFPGISIGLLTGDIKINPEADVLIMTAEILQNTLYRKKQKDIPNMPNSNSLLMFDCHILILANVTHTCPCMPNKRYAGKDSFEYVGVRTISELSSRSTLVNVTVSPAAIKIIAASIDIIAPELSNSPQ